MVIVDSHSHVHNDISLDRLLSNAFQNFLTATATIDHKGAFTPVIMVADTHHNPYFSMLCAQLQDDPLHGNQAFLPWQLAPTQETYSIIAKNSMNDQDIVLIGGQQVVTAEKLETLIFGYAIDHKEIPLGALVELAISQKAIIIIPWGFGKWIGQRGRVVMQMIENTSYSHFFIGDNGGRSSMGYTPGLFTKARENKIRILPGSDPLPLANDYKRIGTYGFFIRQQLSLETPFSDLKKLIKNGSRHSLEPYGKLLPVWQFLKNQIGLRIP